jgi:hypothetical protein
MAQYDFGCEECYMINEFHRSIKIGPPENPVCENCGSSSLTRVYYAVDVCVKVDDPVSLGHLSDRNRDEMSNLEFAEKSYEQKLASDKGRKMLGVDKKGEKFKPWWRKADKVNTQLASLSTKKREDYMATGSI